MKIIVPCVIDYGVYDQTQEKLARYSPTYRPIRRHDRQGYWKILIEAWQEQEPFLVIEPDMDIPQGAIEEMESCKRTWCSLSYMVGKDPYSTTGLGFSRFRTTLMTRFPDLIKSLPSQDEKESGHDWSAMDSAIRLALEEKGIKQHCHGTVEHLHDYSAPNREEAAKKHATNRDWVHTVTKF